MVSADTDVPAVWAFDAMFVWYQTKTVTKWNSMSVAVDTAKCYATGRLDQVCPDCIQELRGLALL